MQLLLALVRGDRSESVSVDQQLAETDAHELYRAGAARLGTDEDTFIHVLTSRSAVQLSTTLQFYLQTFGHDLEKVSISPETFCFCLLLCPKLKTGFSQVKIMITGTGIEILQQLP